MKSLFLVAFVIVLVALCENRKKMKKAKAPQQPLSPFDKRPSNLKAEIYCDACIVMVKETVRELRRKKTQSDLVDVVGDVCNTEKYNSYLRSINS
jgi:hypothetical protein